MYAGLRCLRLSQSHDRSHDDLAISMVSGTTTDLDNFHEIRRGVNYDLG